MNKGWECPKCGRCHAPTVSTCPFCVGTSWNPPYRPYWGSGTTTTYPGGHIYTINVTSNTVDPRDPDDFQGAKI